MPGATSARETTDESACRFTDVGIFPKTAAVVWVSRRATHCALTFTAPGFESQTVTLHREVVWISPTGRGVKISSVRLVSFAMHWIRAEIHEYILRNWRLVKVATTKAQRKLFFNLRSMKQRR